MRGEKLVAFALVLLMVISSTFIGVSFAGPTTIYVSPSEVTADVGETFTVEIRVDGVTDLNAWEFKLRYDTNVLAFPPEVEEGDFLKSVGTTDFRVTSFIYYGSVQVSCALMEAAGASGSGTLAILNFTVVGGYPGKTTLDLFDTKLFDIEMNPIEHDAEDGEFLITAPIADFTWSPTNPLPGETVTFNASTSFSPLGLDIVEYVWDFNDSSPVVTTSDPIITHEFSAIREEPYMVKLTVKDEAGRTGFVVKPLKIWRDVVIGDIWVAIDPDFDTSTNKIRYGIDEEVFVLVTAVNLGTVEETFNVTLECTGGNITLLWENPVTLAPGTGSGYDLIALWSPFDEEGNFLEPGTYTFTATAEPVPGETKVDNNVMTYDVDVVLMKVDFTWEPEQPKARETVWFNASESVSYIGASFVDYAWDFGDGTPVTHTSGPVITHMYYRYRFKPYKVTLTITDEFGNSMSTTKELWIWRDMAVVNVSAPSEIEFGALTEVPVNVTVINGGSSNETVTVKLLATDGSVAPTEQVVSLNASGSKTVTFKWIPYDEEGFHLPPGDYNLTGVAVRLWGESVTANNELTTTVTVKPSLMGVIVDEEKNELYFPNGIESDLKINATITNVGDSSLGKLRYGWYFKGVDYTLTATDLTFMVSVGAGWSDPFNGVTDLSTYNPTMAAEGWQLGFHAPPNAYINLPGNAPINLDPNATFTAYTSVQSNVALGPLKMKLIIWNDTDGDYKFEPEAGEVILSEADYPIKVELNLWKTVQIGYTGKFFDPIQAAINAASEGDTILVYPGKYYEDVTIDKSLTLLGAQAGVDPRGGYRGLESEIIGSIKVTSSAKYIVVDGFKLTATGARPLAGVNMRVESESAVIKNNIIVAVAAIPGYTYSGFVDLEGITDAVVSRNVFSGAYDAPRRPNVIRLGISGAGVVEISDNEMHDVGGGGGIGIMSANASAEIYISGNIIEGTGDGIWIWHPTMSEFDTLQIAENEIVNCSDVYGIKVVGIVSENASLMVNGNLISNCTTGIYLDGKTKNAEITGNVISNCTNYGIEVRSGTGTKIGPCNTVTNTDYGIVIRSATKGTVIRKNNIFNNTRYGLWAEVYLDASLNWWGHPSGPTYSANPLGQGDKIYAPHGVKFVPWLAEEHPTDVWAPVLYVDPAKVEFISPAESNCFTVNVVIANVTDLYGFQFELTWDPTLIELVEVHYESKLDLVWGAGNYYASTENSTGWFKMVATALPGTTGFDGTAKLVNLVFHIIKDVCYTSADYSESTTLDLQNVALSDSNAEPIYAGVLDGEYVIYAAKPSLEIVMPNGLKQFNASALSTTFTVEVWLHNATKVYDYYVKLYYNTSILDAVNVEIITGPDWFEGPFDVKTWKVYDSSGVVEVTLKQSADAPPVYGDGILFKVTFHCVEGITWKKDLDRYLHGDFTFYDGSYVSVRCPTVHYLKIAGDLLGTDTAEYFFVPVPGDVNLDGTVNVKDLYLVAKNIGSTTLLDYDINDNGQVDIFDLVLVAKNYTE